MSYSLLFFEIEMTMSRKDPSSFSNVHQVEIKHSDFEIRVDFHTSELDCYCCHSCTLLDESCREVILDTRDLSVTKALVNGTVAEFKTTKQTAALGSALAVSLGQNMSGSFRLEIWWKTSPNALGAQWLSKELTLGKKHPFFFTQCQAIHARSIFPCLDSPGAKFTYNAAVKVPKPLTAVMSGISTDLDPTPGEEKQGLVYLEEEEETHQIFRFKQGRCISSYLFALAVGNIAYKDVSSTSRIWAEPEQLDAAYNEFIDIPSFLEEAEKLAGPYVWKRYDCLVLPPSFPYGGMENPTLTFVTPTLIAGDKSLVNVIAHEISHSWTGNLVTNREWNGFWLNEGPTVFLERKIMCAMEGGDDALFDFLAILGWNALESTVEAFGPGHKYTRLVPDLDDGADPDDAFSKIPYEKGFAFLYHIESMVGKDNFAEWFRAYLNKFADSPLTPDEFKQHLVEFFHEKNIHSIDELDWDAWYYSTGMPPVTNVYDDSLVKQSKELARSWAAHDGKGTEAPMGGAMDSWQCLQIVAFLNELLTCAKESPLQVSTLRAIEKAEKVLQPRILNGEIKLGWYMICLECGDESILPEVEDFLGAQGRMKYLKPLYRALFRSSIPNAQTHARDLFQKNSAHYHPIAIHMCSGEVGL